MPPGATSVISSAAAIAGAEIIEATTAAGIRCFMAGHCRLRPMAARTNRILTTHAGRLDGPPELRSLLKAARSGNADPAAASAIIPTALVNLVRRQQDAGIDIVGDGELGKL